MAKKIQKPTAEERSAVAKYLGSLGGQARRENLPPDQRQNIAKTAAASRWDAHWAARAVAAGIDPAGLTREQIRERLKGGKTHAK